MAATDLGKVGLVLKGNYNSANAYEVLDSVLYQGGTYIAKQDVPAGTNPTNTTYWQKALDNALKFESGYLTVGSSRTISVPSNGLCYIVIATNNGVRGLYIATNGALGSGVTAIEDNAAATVTFSSGTVTASVSGYNGFIFILTCG